MATRISALGRWSATAVAAAVVAGTAAGCSGVVDRGLAGPAPSAAETSSPAPSAAETTSPTTTAAADPANPATWRLPMEAHLPTDEESRRFGRAMTTLVGDCMRKAGHAYSAPPELPRLGPKTLTDWRYGIHDAALSAERGYHPDAAEQAAYDAAIAKGLAAGTTGAAAEAEQACGVQSKQRLGGGDRTWGALAQTLGNDAFVRSKREPEVVAAFGAWSSCMKERGFVYKEPLDASDDRRFKGTDVSRTEIDTALADLACRARSNVAKVWFDAEVRLQEQALEQRVPALQTERRELDAALRKSADVLAGR